MLLVNLEVRLCQIIYPQKKNFRLKIMPKILCSRLLPVFEEFTLVERIERICKMNRDKLTAMCVLRSVKLSA